MNDMLLLALAALVGMLLGAMYFGGLWWTVKKGLASSRPAQWFIVSLLLRLGFTLLGFYFVAGDDWKKLLACLLGFVLARVIVIRLTETPIGVSLSPSSGSTTSHSTSPASGKVAGYLPQAGERDAVSLRDSHN